MSPCDINNKFIMNNRSFSYMINVLVVLTLIIIRYGLLLIALAGIAYFQTTSIQNHKLGSAENLCDVFIRIKTTSKDKLVELLAHRW